MNPDDPRHGSRGGYLAHRKDGEPPCPACLRGRGRADKAVRIDHHRGVRMFYTAEETWPLLETWLTQGLSFTAIGMAANLGHTHGSRLRDRLASGRPVRRGTYQNLAALTEDSFPDDALVYADLTRTRIYSLMAAGHRMADMPITATGKWRTRTHVSAGQARKIRAYYTATQHTDGTSAYSRTKAAQAGHLPPAAWDDPRTLAWPLGWVSELTRVDVDEVAVQRVLSGDWRTPTNKAERVEVVARWGTTGRSLAELQRLTGWKVERYVSTSERRAS